METKDIDTRDAIVKKMNDEGRMLVWLANKMNINYNTLYSILIQKTINLSDENRKKINDALGSDF